MTALYWIVNHGEWKQFVLRRVNEILRLTNKGDWGHCPSVENPADIGSRDVVTSHLKDNPLWWVGPNWLTKAQDRWPKSKVTDNTATVIEEEKSAVIFVEVKLPDLSISNVINSERYGTAERLFRVTSWVLRFVFNIQTKGKSVDRRNGELSVDELNEAEKLWIREAQTGLTGDEKVRQFSNSLAFIEGILRCRERLQNSDLEYNAKYPILIPRKHRLTELIVQRCHREVHHGGVRVMLSRLRIKFWVVKGRQMLRKILSRCVVCKKLEERPCSVRRWRIYRNSESGRLHPSRKSGLILQVHCLLSVAQNHQEKYI